MGRIASGIFALGGLSQWHGAGYRHEQNGFAHVTFGLAARPGNAAAIMLTNVGWLSASIEFYNSYQCSTPSECCSQASGFLGLLAPRFLLGGVNFGRGDRQSQGFQSVHRGDTGIVVGHDAEVAVELCEFPDILHIVFAVRENMALGEAQSRT
jgi:hypothetical protein